MPLFNIKSLEEPMLIIDKDRINKAMQIAVDTSSLEALDSLPEMNELEIVNTYYDESILPNSLKIVLLNAERGSYLDEIEAYMKYHPALKDADIIFLNELDYGLLRTGNINTTAELSKRLGMNYVFGVEFMELVTAKRNDTNAPRTHQENKQAFHGNAIMARCKLYDPMLIRLPLLYDWFNDEQKRFGTRMALLAKIIVQNKEIGLVCTHLENRTSPEGREAQMKVLLDEIEKRFKNMPVIIAGDMNTNTFDGSNASETKRMYELFKIETDRVKAPEKYEPLFKLAEGYGYDYKMCNLPGKITRRKPIDGKGNLEMNLDWFFTKGMSCSEPIVVNTIFNRSELPGIEGLEHSEGIQFSDHNAISGIFSIMDNDIL